LHESPENTGKQPLAPTAGLQIPTFISITPWDPSKIAHSLPPLPAVLSRELTTAAFTHPGSIDDRSSGMSYDRLEWLGDAYIEMISTALIFQTFGSYGEGKCTQIREILVRNSNLAAYSREYGFPQRAILPPDFFNTGKSALTKVYADIFEAYVAIIVLSDPYLGLARASDWLKALWSKTIAHYLRDLEKRPNLPAVRELGQIPAVQGPRLAAKVRLASLVVVKGVTLDYEDVPSRKKHRDHALNLFTVGVHLTGWGEQKRLLGCGSALSKKEAGEKAAEQALENKKLMKVYEEKKRAYMEARAAEIATDGSLNAAAEGSVEDEASR
jgi:ribonuclease III